MFRSPFTTRYELPVSNFASCFAAPRSLSHMLKARSESRTRLQRQRSVSCLIACLLATACSTASSDKLAELEAQFALLEQGENETTTSDNNTTTSVEVTTTSEPSVETSTSTTDAPQIDDTVPEPEPLETSPSPTLPDYVLNLPQAFEQFRFSYDSVSELPDLPAAINGFIPFEGQDAFGREGLVRKTSIRVFEGDSAFSLPSDFATQMNGCGDAYWVIRWVSLNPDVLILASNEVDPIFPDNHDPDPWILPPAASAGIMGNLICYAPGFRFASTNGSPATLGDIAVEWTYYDRDPFARTDSSTTSGTTRCASYDYDDELPISVCSYGFSVELFQQVLGVDADGYFGPGTETAVKQFQQNAGLTPDGIMNAATWAALGVTATAPYPDLNGDGVIDGSEFPG